MNESSEAAQFPGSEKSISPESDLGKMINVVEHKIVTDMAQSGFSTVADGPEDNYRRVSSVRSVLVYNVDGEPFKVRLAWYHHHPWQNPIRDQGQRDQFDITLDNITEENEFGYYLNIHTDKLHGETPKDTMVPQFQKVIKDADSGRRSLLELIKNRKASTTDVRKKTVRLSPEESMQVLQKLQKATVDESRTKDLALAENKSGDGFWNRDKPEEQIPYFLKP